MLAIDPTSPFSGGAILGDRVRMQDHATDPGVFIRSMATRGHLGGLALATPQAVRVLDAAGKPWILVETVGVGQVEVEVAEAADTTVVVVTPGWGDGVQANKAGLLEIADVFVVNKADRAGVDDTVRDLCRCSSSPAHRDWTPPIVETVATDGTRDRRARRPRSASTAHSSSRPASSTAGDAAPARRGPRHRGRPPRRATRESLCSGPTFDALARGRRDPRDRSVHGGDRRAAGALSDDRRGSVAPRATLTAEGPVPSLPATGDGVVPPAQPPR